LHNHDARMHFWPVTDWRFISPISYWQGSRGGDIVGAVEICLSAALLVYLFRRFKDIGSRIAFVLLAMAEAATTQIWRLFF
ncbi:MAG: cobalamin biosynthesis protein CobQ, partial [Pseudomonadota bacterium]